MTRTPHESAGLSWPSLCLILLSALTLNACEDDPKPPTAEITAPDSAVTVGAWSELSGAQSLNPKGEASALTFEWRLISTPLGSEAQLVDDDTMTPDLRPDLPGAYEVALVVRTSDASSPEVYATVEAGPCGAQDPTVTEVRQHPSEPGVGSVIQLYAVAEDPDLSEACVGEANADERPDVSVGEAPFMVPARAYDLQYQWRLISRPLNSEASLTLIPRA